MYDSISSIIGLNEDEVEYCKEVITKQYGFDVHTFYVRLINRGGRCLKCGTFTKQIKEYREKTIKHSILIKEKCIIQYSSRRFKCPHCGATFYENNPFQNEYKALSNKTVRNLLELLKNYNETFSSVARKVHLSKTEIISIFDEHVQLKRNQLTQSIALDEFYFSRKARKKYALMILSLDKGYIIDLLPNREKHRLISYFKSIPSQERNNVLYISMDLFDNYRIIAHSCFQNAKVCADPFHVISLVNKALDHVRLRILRSVKDKHSDDYYLLKFRRKLLFIDIDQESYTEVKHNHHFKYRISNQRQLEMMLALNSELEKAWYLKEKYSLFDDERFTPSQRKEVLESIIDEYISSNIKEFINVGFTLYNWKTEILNSYDKIQKKIILPSGKQKKIETRVTNGPIEGKNKYIKIMLRLANGYQNFERFRNRAMFVLNKRSTYSTIKLQNTVKKLRKKSKDE